VYCTCQWNGSHHAVKPDIGSESRFLPTPPPAFDAPVRRGLPSEYCHAVWYGKLEWFGYQIMKKFWRYVYSFWHNPRTWRMDGQTHRHCMMAYSPRLCTASSGKKALLWRHFDYTRDSLWSIALYITALSTQSANAERLSDGQMLTVVTNEQRSKFKIQKIPRTRSSTHFYGDNRVGSQEVWVERVSTVCWPCCLLTNQTYSNSEWMSESHNKSSWRRIFPGTGNDDRTHTTKSIQINTKYTKKLALIEIKDAKKTHEN